MPQISVIVPVYKVEPYLCRCVDSILGQSFGDFELILVDDGSPDRCGAICDEYAAKDSRVHVIHQENGGLSAARNAGIDWAFAHSDSQWLSFVDSDDWVHPFFLEYLLRSVTEHGVSVSCCNFQRIYGDAKSDLEQIYASQLRKTADVYCAENGIGVEAYACKYFYKKQLFCDVRFPVGKCYEDVFTTYRVIFQSQQIAKVDAQLYFYFQRETSIAHSGWSVGQTDIIAAYESNLQAFKGTSSDVLLRSLAKGYLVAIQSQYTKMQESTLEWDDKRRFSKMLKKKMKKALRTYGKVAVVSRKTDGYLYAVVYPHQMKVLWWLMGVANKLSEKGCSG